VLCASVRRLLPLAAAATVLLLSSCTAQSTGNASSDPRGPTASSGSRASSSAPTSSAGTTLAGTGNVYAGTGAGKLSTTALRAKNLVYVPNNTTDTVQVIDPATFSVIATYPTGREPQHVVPSWDMKTLWVNDDLGNNMVPIDPVTGHPGSPVPVEDPYNLYFTPDGAHALVMAERLHRIDVHNPQTMALERSLPVPCDGVNHADYSADMTFFVTSCELSGQLLVIDRNATKVLTVINLNNTKTPGATSVSQAMSMGGPKSGLTPGASAMPQGLRLTSDGTRGHRGWIAIVALRSLQR
jgi:YVTN family beta-propeller protein